MVNGGEIAYNSGSGTRATGIRTRYRDHLGDQIRVCPRILLRGRQPAWISVSEADTTWMSGST